MQHNIKRTAFIFIVTIPLITVAMESFATQKGETLVAGASSSSSPEPSLFKTPEQQQENAKLMAENEAANQANRKKRIAADEAHKNATSKEKTKGSDVSKKVRLATPSNLPDKLKDLELPERFSVKLSNGTKEFQYYAAKVNEGSYAYNGHFDNLYPHLTIVIAGRSDHKCVVSGHITFGTQKSSGKSIDLKRSKGSNRIFNLNDILRKSMLSKEMRFWKHFSAQLIYSIKWHRQVNLTVPKFLTFTHRCNRTVLGLTRYGNIVSGIIVSSPALRITLHGLWL